MQVAPIVKKMVEAYEAEGYVCFDSRISGALAMRLLDEQTPDKPLVIYIKTEKPFPGVSFLSKGD